MRLVIISLIFLSGCASIGDIEALNDAGRAGKTTGQVLRTIDSVCKRTTGHACDSNRLNTAEINRFYGNIKQLPYTLRYGLIAP